MDVSEPMTEEDRRIGELLRDRPFLVVANKADLLPRMDPAELAGAEATVVRTAAPTGQGIDALEVFFLTVMLGFRGDLRDDREKLRSWAEMAGKRIAREQGKEWQGPAELDPVTNVPPLRGRERLQRMVLVAAGFVLFLIPLLAIYIVNKLFS